MQSRNDWVDYAKAIGISLVVYGHVARGVLNAGMPMDVVHFRLVDSVLYTFHMPLFFFLSGLFFPSSIERHGETGLLARKIDTIVYPYVLWSLLQGLCEIALSRYTNRQVTLHEVLSFAWNPRDQFWFLYALFEIFVACTIVLAFFCRNRIEKMLMFFGVLHLVALSFPESGYFSGYVAHDGLFFVLGAWFNGHGSRLLVRRRGLALGTCVLFVLGQYYFHTILSLDYTSVGLSRLLLAVTSILFVVFLAMCLSDFRLRWLAQIGSGSMSIYLMHVLAGSGVRVALKKILGVDSTAVHLLVGTLAGLGLPLAAQLLISRHKLDFLLAPPRSISAARLFFSHGRPAGRSETLPPR